MHRTRALLGLGLVLILCALSTRLVNRTGLSAEALPTPEARAVRAKPTVKVPALPLPQVSLPKDALSIHKVRIGTPRSKVQSWFGPGTELTRGQEAYGSAYSDGLETRHPLEVTYSPEGLAVRVSGTALYRGNQKIQLKRNSQGEVELPGVCKGTPAEAMMEKDGNFYCSEILGPPLLEPRDARAGLHLVDGHAWFGIW